MASRTDTSTAALEPPARMHMKGIGFDNARRYVLDRHGDESWSRVLEQLSPQDRAQMEGAVSVGWYDVYLYARVLRVVDACCGAGDLRLLPQVGAFGADRDFNRTLRLLLRVLNPEAVVNAQRRLWSHFNDAGVWEVARQGAGIRGELRDWAVDAALCAQLGGYLGRLIEFTGGKDVNLSHPACRADGRPACVFEVQYR